jgi:hypothetical protein
MKPLIKKYDHVIEPLTKVTNGGISTDGNLITALLYLSSQL